MKKYFNRKIILIFFFVMNCGILFSQRVYTLVPGITVDSILSTRPNASKISFDGISGKLFYATVGGDIYQVYIPTVGAATDTLRFTSADHGITFLQGLFFRDSVMYLCGNIWSSTTSVGKIVKATLQSNGTRIFVDVVTTVPYPSASSSGDHGFAGVNLDPAGNYIYLSSGARTHIGEIRSNNNAWPNYREVPISTRIFKFPVNTVGLILQNDSAILDNSGYVFAYGTRNAWDMAWDGNDTLFAIDNSGERDDPEELNWLREGKNYGFPWRMGSNYNPLMNSPYNVNLDPLVNHLCGGYLNGWFADDPTFPTIPPGTTFTDPVRNYGVDADFFRDSITGQVKNASDEGTYITSFTAHRSPLGLVFDKDSMMATPFRGDAFVLSFMPGGDSLGYTPISPWGTPCPFVDPSRELTQMKLTYNASIDNYTMITSNIVTGFYLPVDAELTNNVLYVIETGGDLWRITFPPYLNVPELPSNPSISVHPNPTQHSVQFDFYCTASGIVKISLTDVQGKLVNVVFEKDLAVGNQNIKIDLSKFSAGIYIYTILIDGVSSIGKISKIAE